MSQSTLFGDSAVSADRRPKMFAAKDAGGRTDAEKRAAGDEAFSIITAMMIERLDNLVLDSDLPERWGLEDSQVTAVIQDLQLAFFPSEFAETPPDLWGEPTAYTRDDGLVPRPECLGVGRDRMAAAVSCFRAEYAGPPDLSDRAGEQVERAVQRSVMLARVSEEREGAWEAERG